MMEPEIQEELSSVPAWLPLHWDPECPVQQHLMQAAKCLKETGRYEEARENFNMAFQKHLQDLNRPHLSFSATFPLFFASLGTSDVSAASCGRAQLDRCKDHISDAFVCCRSLLESIASGFEKEPPQCASDATAFSRQKFVHERCSQAGIYLDMVRLGHSYRKKKRTTEKDTGPNCSDSLNSTQHTRE
eukprot:Skav213684  [mRNA]  locus=scaffold491:387392:391058:- [translate_table: standard]